MPYIAPDERYMIFVSTGHAPAAGRSHFFISYRGGDGSWTTPVSLGEKIHTVQPGLCPLVTPDGKYMFFIGQGDIWWVDAGFIEALRPKSTGSISGGGWLARFNVLRPGFAQLLRRPGGGGVGRHVDAEDAPAGVGEDHEDEQHTEGGDWHREVVTGGDLGDVVGEKGPPGLGGWSAVASRPRYVPADGGLRDVEPELRSSPWMRGAPQSGLAACICRISARMPAPTTGRPARRGRAPTANTTHTRAGFARVPAHGRVGRDDLDRPSPVWPQPRQQDPQQAVGAVETRAPRRVALEGGQLMPQGENLRFELETRPNGGPEGSAQRDEQRGRHWPGTGSASGPNLQRCQEVPDFRQGHPPPLVRVHLTYDVMRHTIER